MQKLDRGDHSLCLAHCGKHLPFADHSFDLVILHDSLDRLIEAEPAMRRRTGLIDLLSRLRTILSEGGVIVGCTANRSSISRLGKRVFGSAAQNHAGSSGAFSLWSCRKLLARSGFVDIETFSILPSAESPLRLINTQADLSRLGFRRELETVHESLSPPGYWLRRLVVELALNRFFEESILFWGRAK